MRGWIKIFLFTNGGTWGEYLLGGRIKSMSGVTNKPKLLPKNRHPNPEPSQEERVRFYRVALERALDGAESGRLVVRIPGLRGLRRREPGMSFHATPEVFLQQQGHTRFRMPEESFVLKAGEVCVMPRGMPHGEVAMDGPGAFRTMIGMFRAGGFSFHLGGASARRTVASGTIDSVFTPAHLTMMRYLDDCAEASMLKGRAEAALVRGLLTAYLALALRHTQPAKEAPAPDLLTPAVVSRCKNLIEGELARPELNVRWLAEQLECSPDHLSRIFRLATGTRLTAYLQERRIRHAKELLEHSDLNMTETAWACGFRYPAYFDQVFRAHTWMTPKEYRKQAGA